MARMDLNNDIYDKLLHPGFAATQSWLEQKDKRGYAGLRKYVHGGAEREAVAQTLPYIQNGNQMADSAVLDPNLPDSVQGNIRAALRQGSQDEAARAAIGAAATNKMNARYAILRKKQEDKAAELNQRNLDTEMSAKYAQLTPHQSIWSKIINNPLTKMVIQAGEMAFGLPPVGIPGMGAGGGGFSDGGWGTAYNGAGGSGIGGGLPAGVPLGQTAGAGVPGWDGSMPNFGWHI